MEGTYIRTLQNLNDLRALKTRSVARARAKRGHLVRKRQETKFEEFGHLAQLVERLVYTENVRGSSPLVPTK